MSFTKAYFIACLASFAMCTTTVCQGQTTQAPAPAPDDIQVEVTGMGVAANDALQDALRAAVGKAVGVAVKSQTTVENFMVVQDAIATNSQGYISSYEVLSTTVEQGLTKVALRARVSTKPLKADAALLAKSLGGVRWMVTYDPRQVSAPDKPLYEAAVDKLNAYLASKRYRYVERSRYEELRREAQNMAEADASADSGQLTYAQQLGMAAGAQFILLIQNIQSADRSEAFDTRTACRVTLSAKAIDNCTAEGLGTVTLDGDWQSGRDPVAARLASLDAAVATGAGSLIESVNSYIGDWVNNGTPFELRFYGLGGYRDIRELRKQLQADPLYGGQLEMTSVANYARLNGTFKRKPEEMADRVLDAADAVPELKARRLDVRLMFGRQLNFAPTGKAVPELDAQAKALGAESVGRQTTVATPPISKGEKQVIHQRVRQPLNAKRRK